MPVDVSQLRAHRALSGWSRALLISELRAASVPLDARELSRRTGLHPSTIRFHLDLLAGVGLARASFEHTGSRGRPRQVWEAVPEAVAPERPDGYRLLAQMLSDYLGRLAPNPEAAGLEAGEAWGATAKLGAQLVGPVTEEDSTARLTRLLGEFGFAPESVRKDDEVQILLRRCPFMESARSNPEVVCSAHLGLLRGALRQMRAPLSATRLDVLVEPSLCVAHLEPFPAGVAR